MANKMLFHSLPEEFIDETVLVNFCNLPARFFWGQSYSIN